MRFRESISPTTSAVFGAGWIARKTSVVTQRDYGAYALVYVTAVGGFYKDAHVGRVNVAPGDVLVIFPGVVHSYGPHAGRPWTEAWIGFRGPVFAALESDGLLQRHRPVWQVGVDRALMRRFTQVVTAVDRAGGTSDASLVARLHHLVVDVAGRARPTKTSSVVSRACEVIQQNLAADLPQVAAQVGVCYDTLRRMFVAELGTTPGRWRQLRRMESAKRVLAQGGTLDAAAEAAGFCDRFFLARQFKQIVGQTPGDWKYHLLGGPPPERARP